MPLEHQSTKYPCTYLHLTPCNICCYTRTNWPRNSSTTLVNRCQGVYACVCVCTGLCTMGRKLEEHKQNKLLNMPTSTWPHTCLHKQMPLRQEHQEDTSTAHPSWRPSLACSAPLPLPTKVMPISYVRWESPQPVALKNSPMVSRPGKSCEKRLALVLAADSYVLPCHMLQLFCV